MAQLESRSISAWVLFSFNSSDILEDFKLNVKLLSIDVCRRSTLGELVFILRWSLNFNPLLEDDVDFNPKYNKKPFKTNSCTIGMSSGFLEPLDAPGLSTTILAMEYLIDILKYKNDVSKLLLFNRQVHRSNIKMSIEYEWWCAFILHQYKTCWKNDTKFWIDHKNVKCDFYDQIIESMYYVPIYLLENYEYMMFFFTTAAKDIQWKSKVTQKPFLVEQLDTKTIHHLEYIQSFYE